VITSFGETPFLSKTPPRGYLVKGFKGTPVPLINYLPLPLLREGGQGDRLLKNLLVAALTVSSLNKYDEPDNNEKSDE